MTTRRDSSHSRTGEEAIQLLAGLVDLGLEQAESAIHRVRGVLGRSDLEELADDGREELRVRGELALKRMATPSEPHMEAVARRVAERRERPGA
ncbi:hypothetical protein [Streptomyces sp. NPDC023838]|uniref:hypothetical protein n=1 Tax=Streptomyces sp. NPDC023838 TaxID=3154325 RepID=UPI00340D7D2C